MAELDVNPEATHEDGLYKKASAAVEEQLKLHRGERFTLDDMCRWMEIHDAAKRQKIAQKLFEEAKHGRLEKSNSSRPSIYRFTDNTLIRMNWTDYKGSNNLDALRWPCGVDQSQFNFDGRVLIPQKALVVIAGVTNVGKSTFCRNFLWMNMDTHRCVYFSSETSEEDFADYASRMTWANPLKEDGSPKFDLVSRNKDFKDVIFPDAVNIIDWLNLGDNFYQIGDVLEGIKDKLKTGMALVALQKDPNKELGMGGMWGEHLASLYLTMDFERLTVKKAKKWHEWNPNGKSSGFTIVDRGAHFHNVRPIKKCAKCFGTGKLRGAECEDCLGTGWVDDITPEGI